MVDALASDRSDQPFGEAVLPRRAWGDGLVADAHGAQSVRDGSAIDAIPIADHVARRLSPRECFGDLACDPVRGRMGCDVDPDEVSGGQPNDLLLERRKPKLDEEFTLPVASGVVAGGSLMGAVLVCWANGG